jgi:hypothetical protein
MTKKSDFDAPSVDDNKIPPMGSVSIFTEMIRGRTLTIVNANDGGLQIEFRISPGAAFGIAGKLMISAIRAKTHNGMRRARNAISRANQPR